MNSGEHHVGIPLVKDGTINKNNYTLQNAWILKILCKVKGDSHKRVHIIWFQLYEMPRLGESIETNHRLTVG